MKVSRRGFVRGSAALGGAAAAAQILRGGGLLTAGGPALGAPAAATAVDEWVPTTCWIGKQDCGVLARRVDGRVVKLQGHPDHPRNQGTLCPKGVAQIMAVYDPNRVKAPLVRTNEKGVAGKWREATWDEALTLVAEQIKGARARQTSSDKKLIVWQKGRTHSSALYDSAFVGAIGAEGLSHSALCADASRRAFDFTIGPSEGFHADFRYTNYLLSWGWNITEAGGNITCQITWNQQLLDARERGMKVVQIDPRLRSAGPMADDWVPIRPGTDLALALALCNALIAQGTIDEKYLSTYTNAPFLVKDDGTSLRVDGKEQVWDDKANGARAFDAADAVPVLDGEFLVDGVRVRTGYRLFKEHVARSTPEWAANICGVPAAKIRQIARDLGTNAMIGATIVLDGVTLPYRPVSIAAYHMSQQELGFQTTRAMVMVMMLLGAIEAVGGQRSVMTWSVHANFRAWDDAKVKDPPYNLYLKDSKYFAGVNSKAPTMIAKVMLEPQRYGVDYVPEVLILHKANPAVSYPDQRVVHEAYRKFKFIAVIDPFLSATADLFADVVLPAATMEKYEGPLSASDQYTDAQALRVPIMEPLFQSRGEIDIYLDLCEKAGYLYGSDGYIARINSALSLRDPNLLPLDQKPKVRDIYDRWAKSQGIAEGVALFERTGIQVRGAVPATRRYGHAVRPAFGGIRHRFYGETLLRYQREQREKGAEEIYWRDNTPFPTWRDLTMNRSPSDHDLTLISYKKIEFKQGRASQIPALRELASEAVVWMNPAAARSRGIKDGDMVSVSSQNAITGEARQVKVKAALTEGIRPDTVAMPHHYGDVARHPWGKDQGPNPTALFFTGEGYVTSTQDQSYQVRVKVAKA